MHELQEILQQSLWQLARGQKFSDIWTSVLKSVLIMELKEGQTFTPK